LDLLQAKNDPTKEILVYFTTGVERTKKSLSANVKSPAIQGLLARLQIGEDKITSAFPDFNEADTLKMLADGQIIGLPNMAKIFRIRIPDGMARQNVIDSLKSLPNVLFAEPNGRVGVDVLPSDQYFAYQWSLQAAGGTGKICAPEAWDIFQGSSSMKIAIIDVGVDGTHPDLNGKVSGHTTLYGYHGTHVAGIAAAKTNNTIGIAGVDWNAQIIAKAFSDATESGDPYISQIINEAVNEGSHILNCSWKLLNDDYTPGRYSTTVRIAFATAYKQNRVAAASMGNTGNTSNTVQYPASFGQGIIAVGSTNQSDIHSYFSTYGSAIDVAAPGEDILSTFRYGVTFIDPNYEYESGTSMSTPYVSGIASLLKGYNLDLANDDIEHIIQLSADDVNSTQYPGWDQYLGYGRVNARKALDYLRSPYTLAHRSSSGGTVYFIGPRIGTHFYGVPGLTDGYYLAKRYVIRNTINLSPAYLNTIAWGRGFGTNGFSANNPNFGMGYCDVSSYDNTTATLQTFVYEIWTQYGQYIGFRPTTPANVSCNYTVLGQIPPALTVGIVGPSSLALKQVGTFTAEVEGGYPLYTYQWYKKLDNSPTWYTLGTNQTQQVTMGTTGFTLKVVVTDYNNNQAEDTHHVAYGSGDPKPVAAAANQVPAQYFLDQSYPNPFNNATTIRFGLPRDSQVKIDVYNIKGQRIELLIDKYMTAGSYETSFNSDDLPSGIYFYRITAGEFSDVKRMLLVK
jgi:subtilisin family serine protease